MDTSHEVLVVRQQANGDAVVVRLEVAVVILPASMSGEELEQDE